MTPLHLVTGTSPRTDCDKPRAGLEFTTRTYLFDGTIPTGRACPVCSAKRQARQAAPLIWPHLFRMNRAGEPHV